MAAMPTTGSAESGRDGEAASTVATLARYADGGPTAIRILLGAQLRRLRESRRISRQHAAEVIRASQSKMSRLEAGRVGFKERDIADLLTLYGVTEQAERDTLLSLARRAGAHGWWHDYTDVLPAWFEACLGLEEAASQIRTFEMQFIPGLLQTEDYARAVTRLGRADAPDWETERRVRLRLARQAVLARERPPHLWAVLDESVLRRPVGGPRVMRGQLEHLAEMARRAGITIQLILFDAGGFQAAVGTFSILRFAEPDLPDVVYLEQLTSALYLDKRETVESYLAVMDRLSHLALTPRESLAAIRAVLRP